MATAQRDLEIENRSLRLELENLRLRQELEELRGSKRRREDDEPEKVRERTDAEGSVIGKKRSGKGKGKEKEKEKRKKSKKSKKGKKSKEPVPKKARYGVQVINPITKNKLTVTDLSHKHNRFAYNIIKAADKLYKEDKEGPEIEAAVDIIAQAIKKGLKYFDSTKLPDWIKERAKLNVRSELGDARYEAEVDTDTNPTTGESFHGEFIKDVLADDEGNWSGEGSFYEDLKWMQPKVVDLLKRAFRKHGTIRTYLTYHCVMVKSRSRLIRGETNAEHHLERDVEEQRQVTVTSVGQEGEQALEVIRAEGDIEEAVADMNDRVISALQRYTENGSGFEFLNSRRLEVNYSHYAMGVTRTAPIVISGGNWIPLPEWLLGRRVWNPKNRQDDKCFVWALLAKKYFNFNDDNINRMKPHEAEVKLPPNTQFPVIASKRFFQKVEELNDFSFSIFALGNKKFDVHPLYVTKEKKETHYRIGLVSGFIRGKGIVDHFVYIDSLSALQERRGRFTALLCERCLSHHTTEQGLMNHEKACGSHEPTRVTVPKPGDKKQTIQFTQWKYLCKADFVVYADFEALLKPTGDDDVYNKHKPISWAYYIACKYDDHKYHEGAGGLPLGEIRSYCGEDAIHAFMESLAEDAEICEDLTNSNMPLHWREGERERYEQETKCHICTEQIIDRGEGGLAKVADHDHVTGEYRGAAHSACNILYTTKKHWRLPVYFHNLKGYDGYHILRGLRGYTDSLDKIDVIAKSLDKFTSFSIDNIRFMDSMQFLLGSLDNNVEQVKAGLSREERANVFSPLMYAMSIEADDHERMDLAMEKGIYPYEYMTSKDTMNLTELPPKESFYSALQNKGISDEDYERAQRMWKIFDCQTLADYTLLYVKLDVLLLASVFEAFRTECLSPDSFRLDPAHFITAPSLSWNAMLLKNLEDGTIIENMTDLDMVMMVERGIRGGICQVMDPLLVASEEVIGFYWDANNLYGNEMFRKKLPLKDYRMEKHRKPTLDIEENVIFSEDLQQDPRYDYLICEQRYPKWHTNDMDELTETILNLPDEDDRGYILEVDLEYPKNLHDEHNDYPFFPESKCPTPSDWTVEQIQKIDPTYDPDRPAKTKKLVLDFEDKKEYVVHYRMLKLGLRHGIRIVKLHRVISFFQSFWLRKYIDFCTTKRAAAKGEIGKLTYKLCANSIYGKMVEDVRRRRNIKVIIGDKAKEQAQRAGASPYLRQWRIVIPDELLLVEEARHSVVLDRPIAVGMVILDESKHTMYSFFYDCLKPKFQDRVALHYTDTDSSVASIRKGGEKPIYQELYELQMEKSCFDLSKTKDKNHPLLQDWGQGPPPLNAGILGKFKDEMFGEEIVSAVFLRPKSYSVLVADGHTHARMKGVPGKATVPGTWLNPNPTEEEVKHGRKVRHEDYLAVFDGTIMPPVKFQNFVHDKSFLIQTKRMTKVGLTNTDDKSYYFNKRESLRYGHWRIKETLQHMYEEDVIV